MSKDELIARAYLWAVGFALIVPIVLAVPVVLIWDKYPAVRSGWVALGLGLAGASWAMGWFGYGLHCIDRAFNRQDQPGERT
jgi:hypothetical protein